MNIKNTFIIDWKPSDGSYRLWSFDPTNSNPLSNKVNSGSLPTSVKEGHQLIPIGNYILDWFPTTKKEKSSGGKTKTYNIADYQLWQFDATKPKLLYGKLSNGSWASINKWHQLVPLGNYILDWEAYDASYRLWNFDPAGSDPLPGSPLQEGYWGVIGEGHELIAVGNYVIDWKPATGEYSLWNFDPQSSNPLPSPAIQRGKWTDRGTGHQLIPIGEYVLDWQPTTGKYSLWRFDPTHANLLVGKNNGEPLQNGTWNDIGQGHTLIAVQPLIPIQNTSNPEPGTMDFMRTKIKHVVYYMIENRSFDHVCGWLYEKDAPAHIIGNGKKSYYGTSKQYSNEDEGGNSVHISKFKNGELSANYELDCPTEGAHHNNYDVMIQLFEKGNNSYWNKEVPTMTGFVDNGTAQMMETYSPEQLPILNGLAKSYAISDEWFSGMPGPTDTNRAFSLTGSSFGRASNFEGGEEYVDWPNTTHRPSIWKILWANGFKDWKIYYPAGWDGFSYTSHLFLKGQIPFIDDGNKVKAEYVQPLMHFFSDAENGTLPKFSYLEPTWGGADSGTPDSYHPSQDLVSGEKTLNAVYNAILNSPQRDETLLIITFDEHGGIYDHVPPPYGVRPYPHDNDHGFEFDLYGVRVPTILISPWINEKTVFRAEKGSVYDATSFLSTMLKWYGIPKERWGLGARVQTAPSFENVINRTTARKDKPTFTPPYDSTHKPGSTPTLDQIETNDLHTLFASRLMWHIGDGKLSKPEIQKAVDELIGQANTVADLHTGIEAFKRKCEAIH